MPTARPDQRRIPARMTGGGGGERGRQGPEIGLGQAERCLLSSPSGRPDWRRVSAHGRGPGASDRRSVSGARCAPLCTRERGEVRCRGTGGTRRAGRRGLAAGRLGHDADRVCVRAPAWHRAPARRRCGRSWRPRCAVGFGAGATAGAMAKERPGRRPIGDRNGLPGCDRTSGRGAGSPSGQAPDGRPGERPAGPFPGTTLRSYGVTESSPFMIAQWPGNEQKNM